MAEIYSILAIDKHDNLKFSLNAMDEKHAREVAKHETSPDQDMLVVKYATDSLPGGRCLVRYSFSTEVGRDGDIVAVTCPMDYHQEVLA